MDSKTEYIVAKPLDLHGIIKGIRNDFKLSQADVAARLEIKPGSYCELENNLLPASTSRFLKLLRALDVELVLRARNPSETDSKNEKKWTWSPYTENFNMSMEQWLFTDSKHDWVEYLARQRDKLKITQQYTVKVYYFRGS